LHFLGAKLAEITSIVRNERKIAIDNAGHQIPVSFAAQANSSGDGQKATRQRSPHSKET
jgi:hypothetical protein